MTLSPRPPPFVRDDIPQLLVVITIITIIVIIICFTTVHADL